MNPLDSSRFIRQARRAYGESPLLFGVSCAAIGMIAGLVLRPSQAERRLLGPVSERALRKAKDTARASANRAISRIRDEVAAR